MWMYIFLVVMSTDVRFAFEIGDGQSVILRYFALQYKV